MFSRIFWPALGAGCVAGLVLALMQVMLLTPLILHAEEFETAQLFDSAPVAAVLRGEAGDLPLVQVHAEGAETGAGAAWAPTDGLERTGYTILATVLAGIGFALMLSAAMTLARGGNTPLSGLGWGMAGFAAVALAPALGLPPELPGSAAGDLLTRQIWWVGTVAVTAGGLALMILPKARVWAVAGLVLLVLPHLVGAPHPHDYASSVPAEVQGLFVARTLVAAAVFWAVLGVTLGWFRQRQTA